MNIVSCRRLTSKGDRGEKSPRLSMETAFVEEKSEDPGHEQKWLDKHGFEPDANGKFPIDKFEGKVAVGPEGLLENIRANVSTVEYDPLYTLAYDERTFVMVCGGPSLSKYLDEIQLKSLDKKNYLVVCSNMTGSYLLENGITAHVHFIIDPQAKKKYDVTPGKTSPNTEYWINAACDPAVFHELAEQGIKPKMFLADFDADGAAITAVRESMRPGQKGMMAIQGGTMAGLRAINLADAMGFRRMEYYGFDAIVELKDGKARPYAYEKKRGEAIIEVSCDRCDAKFASTLIFQKQVNEFLSWRANMPWMDINIIGGGLVDHYKKHVEQLEVEDNKRKNVEYRFTPEYAALQRDLHAQGDYGVTGQYFMPSIFHAISQIAKKYGSVSVLDYGAAKGGTLAGVQEHFWLPPCVETACYDPFIPAFAAEPSPADLVICTDVMEHVEPECTLAVLDHIASLTKKIVFFSISLQQANKVLADGRNAHINLRKVQFWLNEIKKRFITSEVKLQNGEVLLIVAQSIDAVRLEMRARNATS